MTLLLVAVSFTQPVTIPGAGGMGGLSEFPPRTWSAVEGWSMRVVGDRLEIVSPAGLKPTSAHKAEYEAAGVDEARAVSVVTVPLSICILRYGGVPDEARLAMADGAPCKRAPVSPLMEHPTLDAAARIDGDVVTVTVQPAPPKPAPAPNRPPMPQPAPRRPPGARGPSKPTNIVRDVDADEAERVTASKAARPGLTATPAFTGEDGNVTEVDLD